MAKTYEHITLSERTLIQTQIQQGFKPAAIAASLARPRSCISRELARNGWKAASGTRRAGRPAIAGGYSSSRANLRARKLTAKPRVDRRGQIPEMTSIDLRPADIAERLVPGHWEGEHIKGSGNRSQVGTLLERMTRYVALVKLDNGTAQETTQGLVAILQRFDVDLRRSLTYETQGREMAQHAKLTQGHRHHGPLRSSAQPLGAWPKRKYQRLAAPVPAQGH